MVRDSRHMGEEFTKRAASILAANGVEVIVAPRIEPVPLLSFATRYLGCSAGIAITASHNPAVYNGYKVYGPDGCQIAHEAASEIQHAIDTTDAFGSVLISDFDEKLQKGRIRYMDDAVIDAYLDAIEKVSHPGCITPNLRVVYTPLNGTGLECVTRILERIGLKNITVVPEQEKPDGDFPTCPYPNPEIQEALKKGLELAKETGADLLLATDPDADRVGIAVPHSNTYHLLSGNEVGALLIAWLSELSPQDERARKVCISTIVSSDMPDELAHAYGFEMRRTLTGFKYLGEQIDLLEQAGEANRFLLAFEESYGYLAGTHARDKDAVVTSMLIAEMAGWYAERGMDLYEAMDRLYQTYGYLMNGVVNVTFEGAAGSEKMESIMCNLRQAPPQDIAGFAVTKIVDYNAGAPMPTVNARPGEQTQKLPLANVLEFQLEGKNKVIVRPSGTEPKIKAYLFARANTREASQEIIDKLSFAVKNHLFGEQE